jgi:hypothetical protein
VQNSAAKEAPPQLKQKSLDKSRPPPIILTSEANQISLQKQHRSVVNRKFFHNTATGIQITTKNMADYRLIQTSLANKGYPYFTFYTKAEKPIKAVVRHLPTNTSSEYITVALQELGYEIISVRQMTPKHPSPEGGVKRISLLLFLITLAKSQTSQDIFKLTNLCKIIIKQRHINPKQG